MSDPHFDLKRDNGTYPPKGWGWQSGETKQMDLYQRVVDAFMNDTPLPPWVLSRAIQSDVLALKMPQPGALVFEDTFTTPEKPERPQYLTLDNMDEWLPRVLELCILPKQKFIARFILTPYMGKEGESLWTLPEYDRIKTALREDCAVEVTEWWEEDTHEEQA